VFLLGIPQGPRTASSQLYTQGSRARILLYVSRVAQGGRM
jgi:hypothetical protein